MLYLIIAIATALFPVISPVLALIFAKFRFAVYAHPEPGSDPIFEVWRVKKNFRLILTILTIFVFLGDTYMEFAHYGFELTSVAEFLLLTAIIFGIRAFSFEIFEIASEKDREKLKNQLDSEEKER